MTKNTKGKLIVFEGSDGSGKTVQSKLLVNYLKTKNTPVKYFDFPQYYKTFYGAMVARLLRGEFGGIDKISPYLASLIYALDRMTAKEEIDTFLKKGGFVITNRYIQSNMAHQGAKIENQEEKNKLLKWIFELEYKIHKLPEADFVIYLYVPYQISQKLTKNKITRKYLNDKNKDIHEEDLIHLKETEKMYLSLAKEGKNWIKIDCVENEKLLDIDKIHDKILTALSSVRLLSEFDNIINTIL